MSKESSFIRTIKTVIPEEMEYSVFINTDKDRVKFIKRCEKVIRSSNEYRDRIHLVIWFIKDLEGFFKIIFSKKPTGRLYSSLNIPLNNFDSVLLG